MAGILTPRLRNYIIKRDKILCSVENLEKKKKDRLMNRCWQYDCRIRKRIDSLPKLINRLNADFELLERWASEECHYDLITNAVKHVPEITHLIKTSHNSRKTRKLTYGGFYHSKHWLVNKDGTDALQHTFSDGKTKLVGKNEIISDPEYIFRRLTPFKEWVEKQIEQKNSDELKRFAYHILTRLKEEK